MARYEVIRQKSIIGVGLAKIVGVGLATVGAGLGTNINYSPINEQQNPPSPPLTELNNKTRPSHH
ncbi:MAG: hypothetical protein RIE73_00085 [Coleofasciculus sp. C1-SOL-03]|uniref:hypothetical protein n=1 Tax=Coleofasciculus sp. C1-SOL-03 TaxID=3069522 RepID=UPI0032F4DDA8